MTSVVSFDASPAARPHVPVMLLEVCDALQIHSRGVYVDGTFGAGGYTQAILKVEGSQVVAIDRDPTAINRAVELAKNYSGRLHVQPGCFSQLDVHAQAAAFSQVDGVVLDVGVSSMQIDEGARGFSFQKEGPLDMRMAQAGPSAADVVNAFSADDLRRVIATLGEERQAKAVAQAIVKARDEAPIVTTKRLAEIVSRVVHFKPGQIHPATRTFQALRMFVNQELEELAKALFAAEKILKVGGRLVVVAFHSLEDRLVKQFLQARGQVVRGSRHLPEAEKINPPFQTVTRGAVMASEHEISCNPRSRSARMRVAVRTDAPQLMFRLEDYLPVLPALPEMEKVS